MFLWESFLLEPTCFGFVSLISISWLPTQICLLANSFLLALCSFISCLFDSESFILCSILCIIEINSILFSNQPPMFSAEFYLESILLNIGHDLSIPNTILFNVLSIYIFNIRHHLRHHCKILYKMQSTLIGTNMYFPDQVRKEFQGWVNPRFDAIMC